MLNFIYYPISFIMWCWHQVFGAVLGDTSGIAWALSVVFLVFTMRLLLFKPFVSQVRSMRKMQEFAPEMQKLKKKYGNDKQKLAAEMQKLQSKEGFNPLGGCLPVVVQIPVFIGLFQVLREFQPGDLENYFFDAQGVASFVNSDLFGAKLNAYVWQGEAVLRELGTSVGAMWLVMTPLMIMAGVFTHITARHSVARQSAIQAENPQTAIMNKLMLYVFPIGVVVGAPFLPLAVLVYWVANNLWTLGQQWLVYRKIDAEESAKKVRVAEAQQARAPKPGQKPMRDRAVAALPADEPAAAESEPAPKRPGAKPVTRTVGAAGTNGQSPNGSGSNGSGSNGGGSNGSGSNGSANGGARPRTAAGSARQAARRGGGRKRR